jgi:hypothetical protein
MLWLIGIPGCGKSVLSSSVISDIEQLYTAQPDMVLAYFFLTFNDTTTQDPENMVRSLITHLVIHRIQVPAEVSQAYERCAGGKQRPSSR